MKKETDNLYYLSFDELGLSMDSQVDGVHATDLGMQQYADAYYKKITSILYAGLGPSSFVPCRQHRDASIYQWGKRHEEVLAYNARVQPQIVMLGNSITHYWGGEPFESVKLPTTYGRSCSKERPSSIWATDGTASKTCSGESCTASWTAFGHRKSS